MHRAFFAVEEGEQARAVHMQAARGGGQLPVPRVGEHAQYQAQEDGQRHRQVRAVEKARHEGRLRGAD